MKQAEVGLVKRLTIDCLLLVIKSLIATYDLISQPICYFKHQVARRRRDLAKVRSRQINPDDPNSPWRQIDIEPHQIEIEWRIDSFKTYDQMMKASYQENGSYPCYGYRQVLEEQHVKRPDQSGKLLRQVKLSEYKWCTYAQLERQIEAARRGLLAQGVRSGQRVILFADTRAEWQICAQALIRLGAIVATMYSTLGVDGIVHTVNETEASLVITQRDKVDRLMKLADKLPKLNKIVYFETSLYLPRELGGHDEHDEREFRRCCTTTLNTTATVSAEAEAADGGNGAGNGEGEADGEQRDQGDNNNSNNINDESRCIECVSFCELIRSGLELGGSSRASQLASLEQDNNGDGNLSKRNKDSIAVIMYTSGSTGIPKGVLISHGNIQATVKSFSYVTKDFVTNPRANTCTAYLPLAHIFEFCIESVMLYHGVKFGFASPHTLTDKSPGLMPGQQGDLTMLQPTVMIIVPLILDRIVQGVKQAIKSQSYFKEQLITYLIDYKIYWQQRHYETPLVDKLICSKMAVALGGRAKYVICGSAPLSGPTQTFCRNALSMKLPQGYGTTETAAATTCQLFDDQSTQNVGVPVSGAKIKLEPWFEGNYRPDDKPNPRGEVVVGGQMIALGYYNLEEQTREAFYVDDEGTRWYRTGDIGEFLPNGQLKIIDRKKDLVKLQNGEYISLGRVESTLKSNPYTDNFCVYANSNYNYVVALGPANELALRQLAQQIVDELERDSRRSSKQSSPASSSPSSPSLSSSSSARKRRTGAGTTAIANGRLGGSSSNMSSASLSTNQLNLTMTSTASIGGIGNGAEEHGLLLLDQRRKLALAELKEVIASYESDKLNNNEVNISMANCKGTTTTTRDDQREPLVVPLPPMVQSGASERFARLCENQLVKERVLEHVSKVARERNLLTLEVPKKLLLLAEEWTEDKNLVTAAMKIRRNYIYKRYEKELERLYATN